MQTYDLLPGIEEINVGEKILKSQLVKFWDILIVHYDLKYPNYTYESISSLISYNPTGAANYLNTTLRYIGLSILNYLAAQQEKELSRNFIDAENFKLVSTHEIWETAFKDYGLSEKEYKRALSIIKFFKHKGVPKVEVEKAFEQVGRLIIFLMREAKKYEEKKKSLGNSISLTINNETAQLKNVQSSKNSILEQENAPPEELATTQINDVNHLQVEQLKEEQNKLVSASINLETEVSNELKNQENTSLYSGFLNKIKILQKSSTETVVHANAFGPFQNYMHIIRPIEEEIIHKLKFIKTCETPQLMFICGSVGDGKSHLLAYLKQNHPELLEGFYIHNDATESYSRTKSAEETLEQILQPFDDGETATKHIIVAINIGKLHNFYIRQEEAGRFKELRHYIDSLQIFEKKEKLEEDVTADCFHAVDFSKVKYYRIDKTGVSSPFYSEVLQKITAVHTANEIYNAWKQDLDNGIRTIAHENYEMLMDVQVQKRVVEKLVQTIIRNKMIVSTRSFYNFIFDIIVPSSVLMNPNRTGFALQNTLPNLLFESLNRSDVLSSMSELDPLNDKGMLEDEIITNIFIHADVSTYLKQLLCANETLMFEKTVQDAISKDAYKEIAKYAIRIKALLEDEPSDSIYSKFIQYIYSYYKGEYEPLEELFEILEQVLFKWKGSPRDNYIYVSNEAQKDYRLAVPVDLVPKVDEFVFDREKSEFIEASEYFLTIGFNEYLFELDLRLFEFLILVNKGYCPNLTEINEAIQFEEFYNKVVREAEEKEKRFLLVHLQSNTHFEVAKPKSKFTKNKYEVRKV